MWYLMNNIETEDRYREQSAVGGGWLKEGEGISQKTYIYFQTYIYIYIYIYMFIYIKPIDTGNSVVLA